MSKCVKKCFVLHCFDTSVDSHLCILGLVGTLLGGLLTPADADEADVVEKALQIDLLLVLDE